MSVPHYPLHINGEWVDTNENYEVRSPATGELVATHDQLGPGESSVWNTIRPRDIAADPAEQHAVADATFAWVHVDDLAAIAADLATGAISAGSDARTGPVAGGCTPVNVAGGPATQRDYLGAVASALGLEPTWDDEPAWTGQISADRARGWGWSPEVSLEDALAELQAGLRES